jgi:hypothetical protein
MSNETTKKTPLITTVGENAEATTPEKQSFYRKSVNFVKQHKTPAIVAVGLVTLTGVAALTGRKTAPQADVYLALPATEGDDETIIVESEDTVTA